jgi:Ca2+-dependent lipid-binding protein
LKDSLTINLFDYNDIRKDKELGTATFALEQLEEVPDHENMQLEVMSGGRARGMVTADVRFFPVLEGTTLEDGTKEPPPESRTGICKFTVEQAKDMDGSKSMIGQRMSILPRQIISLLTLLQSARTPSCCSTATRSTNRGL